MPYSTKQEVRYALARNLDRTEGTAASLSDPQLDNAILEADNRIDGRLSARYTVPFVTPYPALVTQISRDIAAYLADLSFREVRDYNSALNPVYLRYQDAIKLLDQIGDGKIVLPDAPGVETPTGSNEAVIAINQTPCPLINPCDFDLWAPPNWWP